MKRFLRLYSLAIIAFLASIATLRAQATMDAQWTVVTNNGSQLVLELGIRTNTPHEHLGPAQFVFAFSNTNHVSFAGGGDGVNGTNYNWIDSFGPPVYGGGSTGVTQPVTGVLDVQLDFSGTLGAAISATTAYTPVVDLVFAVSDPSQSTTIIWGMSQSTPGTYDFVSDDNVGNPTLFDTGIFSGIVIPLPVTLSDFHAWLSNSITKLSWVTASEINNAYFTIERSADGSHFSSIAQIKGSGNSETKKEYTALDESPLPGLSYYRLRQTDFNGASQIFNMVPINNTNTITTGINIITASANTAFPTVSYTLPEDELLTIIVIDMSGKTIHKLEIAGKKGLNSFTFSDASTWKSGIYSVILESKDQSTSTKMFIP